jgi:hypothetical protein
VLCEEKARLIAVYCVALMDYKATDGGDRKPESSSISRLAQERSEIARLALDRHIAEHGC